MMEFHYLVNLYFVYPLYYIHFPVKEALFHTLLDIEFYYTGLKVKILFDS